MALKVGLGESFDNMWIWKGIGRQQGTLIARKLVINAETSL
jgi:hypothetical protein